MLNLLGKIASWLGRSTQPAPLDANHPFFQSADYKAAIAGIIQSAFADGEQAERKRIAEVLQAPGVASYPLLVVDLAIGGATAAQVAMVIARAEVHVQARLHPTESPFPASTARVLH